MKRESDPQDEPERAQTGRSGAGLSSPVDILEREQQLRREADERLALLTEATHALIGALDGQNVVDAIISYARRIIAADAYAVWRFYPERGTWEIAASRGLSEEYQKESVSYPRPVTFPSGLDPLLIEDVHQLPMLSERREGYLREGISSLLIAPLQIHGDLSGTITFYYRQPHRFSETEVRLATALTHLAASAIQTVELYEAQQRSQQEAERARNRQELLAEVSVALSSSLDYATTLSTMADLAVPTLADWCAIDVAPPVPGGPIRRLATAHKDPEKRAWAQELHERYPTEPDSPRGLAYVLREGVSEYYPVITDEMLVAGARDEEHLALVRGLGLRSVIIVPLNARGRTLGALTLVTTAESGTIYTREDLEFAEELARRAALAIDNALLYQQAQRNQERYQALAELTSDYACAYRLDPEGTLRLDWISDSFLHMSGYSREELEAAGWPLMAHPEDAPTLNNATQRLLEGHEVSGQHRFQTKSGEVRWLQTFGKPMQEAQGKIVGFYGASQDITERRRTEDSLRLQSRVLESMSEGVSLSDEDGFILYTNPAEDAMFGYLPGELTGKHVTVQNALPPEENQRVVAQVIDQLKAEGLWVGEFANIRKDGTPFTTLCHITALEMGGRPHWVCVQRDITEEKRAREALSESDARQRSFAREVLFSVSGGKLRLCETADELPPRLDSSCTSILLSRDNLATLRDAIREAAVRLHFAEDRFHDLSTAVSEAAMNAVVHAKGGHAEVCEGGQGTIQVWVVDQGAGIAVHTLHRATLERGFTTAGSFGHGFWLMLRTADRIWLRTTPTGTTVVLEQDHVPPRPEWLHTPAKS